MGDKRNSDNIVFGTAAGKRQVLPIRPMLNQAPLNVENLSSKGRGGNYQVLPPQFMMNGNINGRNGCPPPMTCCMPPPACPPCPMPMYCPPQCPPPMFCCPPQPPYNCFPYQCMPMPGCCPPPCPCPCPCPPEMKPQCCKPSSCCGAGATLVCVPRPPKQNNRGCERNNGMDMGSEAAAGPRDQPASYNNCNFYVTEMPKGLSETLNRNRTGTSGNPAQCNPGTAQQYDECLDDQGMTNFSAGDGKIVPPPVGYPGSQRVPWGNDQKIAQSRGGRRTSYDDADGQPSLSASTYMNNRGNTQTSSSGYEPNVGTRRSDNTGSNQEGRPNENIYGNRSNFGPGSRMTTDGSNMGPNGNRMNTDGSGMYPDDSNRYMSGSRMNTDGSNLDPSGSRMSPDGSRMSPDGSRMSPDGSRMSPDGSNMGPSGSNMGRSGSNMGPSGSRMNSDESNMDPSGSRMSTNRSMNPSHSDLNTKGRIKNPKGSNMDPSGSRMNQNGNVNPSGSRLNPKGSNMDPSGSRMSTNGSMDPSGSNLNMTNGSRTNPKGSRTNTNRSSQTEDDHHRYFGNPEKGSGADPVHDLKRSKSANGRLMSSTGQDTIRSLCPPAAPVKETLATILAKKEPLKCKWHERNLPPFHDYCYPSGAPRANMPHQGMKDKTHHCKNKNEDQRREGKGVKRRLHDH